MILFLRFLIANGRKGELNGFKYYNLAKKMKNLLVSFAA